MNYNTLIGRSLEEAKFLLDSEGIIYEVKETKGFKDKDLLKEPYVIAVREASTPVILVSYFLTKIKEH
ncbi:hypothetical protein [Filifactor villosus]|uniref:Uncharacterized protein n=1 Tax=Filifactor villosus TaxID=29374 RepID=A0ABV9QL69_9FIRM